MKKQVVKKPQPQQKAQEKSNNYFIGLLLILAITAIAFSPAIKNGFTNWDDPSLITENPLIKDLNAENLKLIFTKPYFGNYQPLHIFSYAIEYKFFGLNATGYHVVSLLMHLINVVLVFFFIRLLSKGNNAVALVVCMLWAANPMRTESVCWAAERKDLLYSMFFFAACISYLKYLGSSSLNSLNKKQTEPSFQLKYLIYTFLLFVISVFSKAMAVSLVPVLFLIDFYLNRKFTFKSIAEKIPFIILAIVMGLISIKSSGDEGSIDTGNNFTFIDRIFFASHNLIMYAVKSIVPFSQSAFYSYPEKTVSTLPAIYYAALCLVLLITILVFISLRKNKLTFFCFGFFVSTTFLILMLIPVGPTIFSERYTYIPSLALFFFIATLLNDYVTKNQNSKTVLAGILIIYSLIMAGLTFNRSKIWKDSLSLWKDAVQEFPTAAHALNNLGDAYFKLNILDTAVVYFTQAINNVPDYASAYYNRGNAFGQMNKPKEALDDLNNAIKFDPKRAEAYNKRGQANALLGNFDNAFADFNKSLELKPTNAEVYFNLGITYLNMNKKEEGCTNLKRSADMGFEAAAKAYNEVCLKK